MALSNETFRDMCEEYGLAVGALDLLEQRNLPQDVERMHEYRALIKQLERDLKYELLAALRSQTPAKKLGRWGTSGSAAHPIEAGRSFPLRPGLPPRPRWRRELHSCSPAIVAPFNLPPGGGWPRLAAFRRGSARAWRS